MGGLAIVLGNPLMSAVYQLSMTADPHSVAITIKA